MASTNNDRAFDDGKVRYHFAYRACAALGIGFGVATAAMLPYGRLRNLNGSAALLCGLAALAFRAAASNQSDPDVREEPLVSEPSDPGLEYSIVVPVYNRREFIAQLMSDLADQAPVFEQCGAGEILILDDGSVDGTADEAERLAGSLPLPTRVLRMPHRGPAQTRNAGTVAARGKILVSIDSDCRPSPSWLPGLLTEVRRDRNTAAFARLDFSGSLAYPIENVPDRKGIVTASFAIDRELLCAVGGVCSEFGVSHDDLDLIQRLKFAGVRIARADALIEHPMRTEGPASLWRVGQNSKYANLLLRRHGRRADGVTRTTPYYLFGIAGNYGSSIAIIVATLNLAFTAILAATDASFREKDASGVARRAAAFGGLYLASLSALGLRVGAGAKRLPYYVASLGIFQVATCLGRLRGSIEYGIPLL